MAGYGYYKPDGKAVSGFKDRHQGNEMFQISNSYAS